MLRREDARQLHPPLHLVEQVAAADNGLAREAVPLSTARRGPQLCVPRDCDALLR